MRLTHQEVDERIAARADEFLAGVITEDVFRASVFALGKRGQELDLIVYEQKRIKHERNPRHAAHRETDFVSGLPPHAHPPG